MRFSGGALELITIILLSAPYEAQAAPKNDGQALEVRGGTPPPPDPKDDGLPKGAARDLNSWTDDDYTHEDYKSFPDYDPDQDVDLDPTAKPKPKTPPKKGTTEWLRFVGVDGPDTSEGYLGKDVRQGFLDDNNKKFIGTTGDLKKDNQIGMLEATEEFVVPKPKPKGYKSWQADHVNDLGIYVTIASEAAPDGIDKNDWVTIQDAILGEQDKDVKYPTDNSKTLGKELNNPNNIRGITYKMNQLKNAVMKFSYTTQTTKSDWKAWNRSNVWGLYRYMKETKDQFDEVTTKATDTIQSLIMDEASGEKIAKHYRDEINRIYNKAITELERVLSDPPPSNDKDSIFHNEDCKNTKDSPNTPPPAAGSSTSAPLSSSPPPPPTTPTIAPVIPPAKLICNGNPATKPKDSHEPEMKTAATFFCSKYASDIRTTPNVNIVQTVVASFVAQPRAPPMGIGRDYTGSKNEDDVYDFTVTSVDMCIPDGGGYNLKTPIPENKCVDILESAWRQCNNNQGRGGSIVAGCLTYGINTKY